MGKIIVVLLLAGAALPSFAAAVRVNVGQLEEMLNASKGRSDSQIADQLSGMELTERVSEVRLMRLEAGLPGARSRKGLTLLADASAFLNLPGSDLPDAPKPEYVDQVRLFGLARNYVTNAILKLPNFFATRETTNYVSTLADNRINSVHTIPYKPFEEVDASQVTVLYRNGHELTAKGDKYRASSKEVRTRGEFGPILIVVLNDASKGRVTWSHWERSTLGLLAVFDYAVPEPASHYLVVSPGQTQDLRYYPAYHGEIALNPKDGSILRLTVVPEMKADDPMTSADLMVDYGQVEIGGIGYICPVKSVALSQVRVVHRDMDDHWDLERKYLGPSQIYLNDVIFDRYHLFRSESRVLSGEDANAAAAGATKGSALRQPEPSALETSAKSDDPIEISEAFPSQGALRFSANDLEQGLSHDRTYGLSDQEIAEHLSKVHLTERLAGARLAHIQAELPNPIDQLALEALADESAFLDLPEADIPARPAPDKLAQATMLAQAMNYVQKTLPKLPGLSATARITCFANTRSGNKSGSNGFHKVSALKVTAVNRSGHETLENVEEKGRSTYACALPGEETSESVLATVLTDAGTNAIDWSHWETGDHGLEAVFSYSVPQESSHYPLPTNLGDLGQPSMVSSRSLNTPLNPGYHGEIALNPLDGSILRMTVVAETNPDNRLNVANTSFEYAPVEIEGVRYICPKKSVALYRLRNATNARAGSNETSSGIPLTYLDDAVFLKYRLDRSDKQHAPD